MLHQQQSQPTPGRYSGTAVPHVSGPSYSGYTQPQNWANPAVSGRDLIVHRDVLRQVAADLARMADQLQTTLSACAPAAALAGGAAGGWPQAQQLNQVMSRAHAGVTQFTGQLQQAHTDMAARLATSADRYDAAEQQITSLIHAATDPSAMIIRSGGQDMPVQPGYGQNWTPQQPPHLIALPVQKGYFVPGGAGTQFTAAQAKWSNDNQAILYPSGGWIENEMKDATKSGFEMTGAPEPTVSSSPTMPYASLRAAAGEPYIVPSQAKNVAGGKEILRAMLSKAAATNFSKTRLAPTIVKGLVPANGFGSTALVSQTKMLDAAGTNVFNYQFVDYYGMNIDQLVVWNSFLSGQTDVPGLTKGLQTITDKIANDSSVKKLKVT